MSPGSVWNRALLRAGETEEGSFVNLGSLEEGKRDVLRSEAIMPRENAAWSSSDAAVSFCAPSVSFDKSEERIAQVIETRQQVSMPAIMEGCASSSSGV
jgi:hypothetical protein